MKNILSSLQRIRLWYAALLLVFSVFVVRLFYLQIIRHSHYETAALSKQLKEYEIPAERGIIEAYSGDQRIPIVLNEIKYTLFADPKFIDDPKTTAIAVATAIGGDAARYEELMQADSRYAVLAKKLGEDQKNIIDSLELKGVGTRETPYRTYPQGSLAAQLLGFVNDEGEGKYGIEDALNDSLSGSPGLLKAITDARGIPLAANKDNIAKNAEPGRRTVLTIDIGMQKQLEEILAKGVKHAIAPSGGALIMDIKTGAIKAMANYPTFSPAEFYNVKQEDIGVFENGLASSPLEVGSIMKPLTMAAALDLGVVTPQSSYYEKGYIEVDGETITNVLVPNGPKVMRDILQQSINTGVTWLLKQMGGGEINQQARERWHDYMTNHYNFGKKTGIEQFENVGVVPDPNEGFGLNIRYANTTFGQGMTATPLQMAAAFTAVLDGGKYLRPHLVDRYIDADGNEEVIEPEVLNPNVVKPQVGKDLREMLEYSFGMNHAVYGMPVLRDGYSIGAKTGTPTTANPEGGYYADRDNGMMMGFVGGDELEYVIVVRVDQPKIGGYAGAKAAGPVFVDLVNMLIDNFGVAPKG